jgi:hypothetical protein
MKEPAAPKRSDDQRVSDPVVQEISALRASIDQLRFSLGVDGSNRATTPPQHRLSVFITRSSTATKPFSVQCDGDIASTFKLSSIRTAIFVVLLLDLEDRLEGGRGVEEPLAAIAKTLRGLEPNTDDPEGESPERIRVAVYRFWEFCQSTNHLKGANVYLDFDDKRLRLTPKSTTGHTALDSLKIEVTSTEPEVSSILAQTLTRSPIEQVRKRKALYVPPGPEGADRLLLEMYDHPHGLTVTSLYVRPPLPSYPDALLEKLAVSPRVLRRKALAFEGYRTGRFNFFEVLNEHTIWDLIRYSPHTGFKLYPRSIGTNDVAAHLENLISILSHFENYHLYITKMVVPFVVVTYDIKSSAVPESFTVFFQAFSSAAERDLGCFAMCDRALYQSISDHIVQWLVSHPSTVKKRGDVIALLQHVRDHLMQNGALSLDEPIPVGPLSEENRTA